MLFRKDGRDKLFTNNFQLLNELYITTETNARFNTWIYSRSSSRISTQTIAILFILKSFIILLQDLNTCKFVNYATPF